MTDLLVLLAVLVLLPTVAMVPIRRVGRIFFFAFGLIFAFGIGLVMELGGPDSPGLMIPFIGIALAVDAMLAEALAWAWSLIQRRRAVHG